MFFPGPRGEGAADKVGEGDPRNLKRILEGEEHAELCTLVSGFFRDVLASEEVSPSVT